MSPRRRLAAALAVLAGIMAIGVVGFMVIEEMSLVDALYMTVITISTVGFREVEPLGDLGEAFTILLIVFGVGTALYTAALGLETMIEAIVGGRRATKQVKDRIDRLDRHVILCGWGRVGSNVWDQLVASGSDVVVIDSDPGRVEEAIDGGALAIEGDATRDETLVQAGIDRARVLIAAVRSDSDNLVIVLSAKARRRDLLVVSRVVDAEAEKKLFLAGADRVVAPQVVGAHRLAALALRPDLAEFIDLVVSGKTVEFQVEELPVHDDTEIIGKSLRELDLRNRAGALVLAVRESTGRLALNPDPSITFHPGQVLIAIGTEEQLAKLRTLTG